MSSALEEKREYRAAWTTALPRMLLNGVQWARASGPLQGTIAAMGQLGWVPAQPARWLAPDGATDADLEETDGGAQNDVDEAIQFSAETAVWRTAASHFLGGGLEEGTPSLRAAKEARSWFVRRGRAAEAKALDAVVCGGTWPGGARWDSEALPMRGG